MDRHPELRKPGLASTGETVEHEAEHDEESALLEYMSFRDKQAKLESHRWAGYSESHPALQVLDILQESTTILRKHNGVLLAVALVLAVPLSALLLSHVLLLLPLMEHLVSTVQLAAERRFQQHAHQTCYRRLAETLMSNAVDIPFSALFSPLLKASVAYVVATTYARKKLKLADIFEFLQKIWFLLMQTVMWTFSVYLTFAFAFATVLWFDANVSSIFFGSVSLLLVTLAGLALAAGLAFANVMCNLAYVVSVLEGIRGSEAMIQSVRLLKGKLAMALLLFLVTNVNSTLLDILFEFHIIRNGDASTVYNKYWEAPLLVCMHSFVHLFDAIMISVLYFICKSSETDSRLLHPAVEHFSGTLNNLADVRSPLARGSPMASSMASRSPSAVR